MFGLCFSLILRVFYSYGWSLTEADILEASFPLLMFASLTK